MEVKGVLLDPAVVAKPESAETVKNVGQEFETLFIKMMLNSMRNTVGEDKLTGGGRGEETFRSLLDQEYASAAAKSGQLGLSEVIEREIAMRNYK